MYNTVMAIIIKNAELRKTKNTFLLAFTCSLSSDDEESASVCWVFHLQLLAFPVCKFPCIKFGKMKGKEKNKVATFSLHEL